MILQRDSLTRRLESNESLLKEKEDEVFLQLERVVFLEEQCDKVTSQFLVFANRYKFKMKFSSHTKFSWFKTLLIFL